MSETAVNSFVLRFIQEQDSVTPSSWRGLIRHVQTDEETYFIQIDEALSFIARFVEIEQPLGGESGPLLDGASPLLPSSEGDA